jgi:hypothetical protein
MAISDVLASIDSDIAKLQQARALLSGDTGVAPRRTAGRPKKATAAAKKTSTLVPAVNAAKKKKRNLSPEGRKRIAEAVKKRWADKRAAEAE